LLPWTRLAGMLFEVDRLPFKSLCFLDLADAMGLPCDFGKRLREMPEFVSAEAWNALLHRQE
jgi:hypothetical protein